jgi:hypothetical protein
MKSKFFNDHSSRPSNYDELNDLDMRSAFEDEESEPMIFTTLVSMDEDEDGRFVIRQEDEDGLLLQNFYYNSREEYEQDCKILGI